MFYTDGKLQFPVRVEIPDPQFARALQQAIGGVEGEIRVAMQYFFQACGARGNPKFRDLLMNTAAEELGHIEMLATAVALNLEGAPVSVKDEVARDPVASAVLGGLNMKNLLSAGLSAMPVDSDGVPFDMSHIYASGNIAADMTANVAAESTGRVLATRLFNLTTDPGMKQMLSYLIARDTMHQNQWMAALEELGGASKVFPIPNSFSQEQEMQDFSYAYLGFQRDGSEPAPGRWSEGRSIDGKGSFKTIVPQPMGEKPVLAPAKPNSGAQAEQI
ncbi:manganese catalase family protein [Rhizobium hidalgonense]|uniref:Catalase n=1 Tax=Rhizobium hidalgonense TaxID=1538159 RepID=A0A2A6K8F3_9HYPH|nr:manganese catalase family protein [Rhizobium hidalgonense]MDR9775972.1 manganese catalase family protein [Rhizobium hidalgonense]MDR9815091.1 manganese catalase family protein [Rhizobium hidalgonense]MDR9820781.1 manganese catalase family protein [Rhizobium hidalgonense]PDT20993.1 catalase [Rhizobium hidalgonense]PON07225.1 catalase [Rhizobium hidalgonense]